MEAINREKLPDIVQTVILEAPIQKVWETVSTAKGITKWFMPNDFKQVVGYEFTIQSPYGPSPCKVTEIDAPHRLSFIWDTNGWTLTFILKELGNRTEFTLIHGGWGKADSIITKANRKASEVRDTMNNGWIGIVHSGLPRVVSE